jgi:transposase
MLTVGLDTHARSSSICVLNPDGKVVNERRIAGPPPRALAALALLEEPFRVCFEASLGYGPIHDALSALPGCRSVVVAHPGQLRLIFRSKRKSDRIDARKLATLQLLDQVPAAYVPSVDVRAWRMLIEHRRSIIDKRVRAKNALRSLFRAHGIETPRSLWSKPGLRWMRACTLPTEAATLRRDMLLDELEHFEAQTARVTRRLDELGAAHPGVRLLRTIPGVGPRTAEVFVAYVDNPKRFGRTRRVGAYFGMVPCLDESAERSRYGHITRQGPPTARKLIVEAAWRGICKSPSLRARYERVRQGDPGRNKIALVATAHHLLRVMLSMLKTQQPWEERAMND